MCVARSSYYNQDYARTVNALIKATAYEKCNPEAQYALGYMYYYGLGIVKDQDIGRMWITKSARRNYLPAIQALNQINRVRENQYKALEQTTLS